MAVPGAAQAARYQGPGEVSDRALLRALQSGRARCAGSSLDPDEWFPVSPNVRVARIQAARAIALCTACPVRAECLEFAMRNWTDGSGEGVWGGFVAAERRAIRRRWLLGVSVTELLDQQPEGQQPVSKPPALAPHVPAPPWLTRQRRNQPYVGCAELTAYRYGGCAGPVSPRHMAGAGPQGGSVRPLLSRLLRFFMLVTESRNCILSATLQRAYHEHTTPSAKSEARAHSGTSMTGPAVIDQHPGG